MSTESQGDDALPRANAGYSYRGIDARMAEVKRSRTGRCLLALDGGGIRGFSQIEILHEIASRIKHDQGLENWPCLCDYFDMIGGVGTGGYIAILIGRMGLVTPVLKEEFMALLAQALAGPMEVTELNGWLKELVRRHTGNPETLMFDRDSPTNHCRTFVGANTAGNIAYQTKLRSYEAREEPSFNPPIWQVLRATLAHPSLFPGVKIGPNLIHQVYISGEFGWNNPSHEVIKEFESQWKHQSIECLANIGTGYKGLIKIEEINGSVVPTTLGVALEQMATDCERIADEITTRFQGQSTYYRLSVDHGVERNNLDIPLTLGDVVTHTKAYLCSAGVSISVDRLVESLVYPFEVAPWSVTGDHFQEVLDSYIMKAKERIDKPQTVDIRTAAEEVIATFENIRNTTSNEENWLKLVKEIDNHLSLITQNDRLKPHELVSATSLWDSIKNYFKELRRVEISIDSLLKLNSHKIWGPPILEPFLSKCLANLEESFKTIQSNMINDIHSQVYQHSRDKKLEKLLNWVSSLEPQLRHDDVRVKRSKGTGTWFLNTPEFQNWSKEESSRECRVLYSTGKPGAGKTIVCSSAIEHLREKYNGRSEIAIAFLYCDYRDKQSQTGPNMIGGLTKQLIWQAHSTPQTVWEIFERNTKERKGVDLDMAEKLFTFMVHTFRAAYICIDALDECEPQHRYQLLHLFNSLSQTSLHLFLTGRQSVEAEVRVALASLFLQNVPIVANEEDIRISISQRIAQDPYPEAMDEKLKEEIVEKIVRLSQGIFLLPMLHIQSILEHETKRDRRLALSNIPSELFETYNVTFERIKQQSRTKSERALAVLNWVYLAQRQLDVLELQHALAVKPGDVALDTDGLPSEKALVDCCVGLVVVEAETSTVRLTHFTLQEYLNKYWTNIFPLGHTIITTTCLTYLSFDHCLASCQEMARISPLIRYVVLNVGHHIRMASNPTLDQQMVSILNKKEKFRLLESFFEELVRQDYYFPKDADEIFKTSSLHWTAFFGTISIIKLLLPSAGKLWVDAQDIPALRTPLSYAAQMGHTTVVQLLLSSLSHAADDGHEGVLQLPVGTRGVDVNSRNKRGLTPLSFAAIDGREEVVKLLLNIPGVDVNSRDEGGRTPLFYACMHGEEEVVRLLVGAPGVDVESKDSTDCSALSAAANNSREGVARLLISTPGVDVNSVTDEGWTPLSFAANIGSEGVVRLLVGRPGVDVDSRDKEGFTPLSLAALNGWEEAVKLLLNTPGVDVNSRDEDGRTPLFHASMHGLEGVVRLLLGTQGVDVDSRDKEGLTPLSDASVSGREEVVKLLLNTPGVDVNSRDEDGRTPLSHASIHGHEGVVRLLLGTQGVEVDSRDKEGLTPLSYAAVSGREKVVKLLLNTPGVDVNSRDEDGRTPLFHASISGYEGVVRPLVGTPVVDVESRDSTNCSALSISADNDHEGVAQLLINTPGVDVNSRDNYGRTSLTYAAWNGQEKVVQMILGTPGVDVNPIDKYRRTPLSYAIYEYEGVAQLLLDHGGFNPDEVDPLSE